ncbi:MAG: TIGR00730 family Rossman fold protein [Solirubrobacterales bacterium]
MTDEPAEAPAQPSINPDRELFGAWAPAVPRERSDADRVALTAGEMAMGFSALSEIGPAISIFGSARVKEDDPLYEEARAIARRLGEAGFAIITGGGPGLMEAANRGARDAGALSVGLNIDLPYEQHLNPYVDLPLNFHYFYTRKLMFVRFACGFVVMPGGFGTIDEAFEAFTLIQTGKVEDFPVVLFGEAFWGGLRAWVRENLLGRGMIEENDLRAMLITDDVEDVVKECLDGALLQGFVLNR